MNRQGRFTGGLRSVDLYDPALGQTADSEGAVQRDRTGRDRLHLFHRFVAQLHDGALAVRLFDLVDRWLQGFQFLFCRFFLLPDAMVYRV